MYFYSIIINVLLKTLHSILVGLINFHVIILARIDCLKSTAIKLGFNI